MPPSQKFAYEKYVAFVFVSYNNESYVCMFDSVDRSGFYR